ncbi:helix-turn-helix domain-containing protein [Planctomycetota bacterium]
MSEPEAAQRLKVSIRTLRRWRSQGLPHRRAGRQPRYDRGAVKAWMAKHNLTGERGRPDLVSKNVPPELLAIRIRKTKALAERYELNNRVKRGQLVDSSVIATGFEMAAARLRSAGERLERAHGVGAREILDDALTEADRAITRWHRNGKGD